MEHGGFFIGNNSWGDFSGIFNGDTFFRRSDSALLWKNNDKILELCKLGFLITLYTLSIFFYSWTPQKKHLGYTYKEFKTLRLKRKKYYHRKKTGFISKLIFLFLIFLQSIPKVDISNPSNIEIQRKGDFSQLDP